MLQQESVISPGTAIKLEHHVGVNQAPEAKQNTEAGDDGSRHCYKDVCNIHGSIKAI